MRILRWITTLTGAAVLSFLAAFPSLAAGWQQNGTGYWYEREDKSYPAGAWEQIDGTWYLFDRDGYMLTGWQQVDKTWYYLGTDGAMVYGTTMTIDGIPYTFDNNGVMADQTASDPVMGHWAGSTFINEWSDLRLTVPQGYHSLDSSSLSEFSDSGVIPDMVSIKNDTCAVMVLYMDNADGDSVNQAMSFLNMFQSGSHTLEGGGAIETVQAGNHSYLRFYFPSTKESPLSGYLYVRSLGNYYVMIAAVSDAAGASEIREILSTLS